MKGKNFSTNNSSGKRKKSDFYETPYSLTRLLLEKEKLEGTILEPACGNGAIVKVLNEFGYEDILCSDKENNFLTRTDKVDTIITNPPFSLAKEFILKCKELSDVFFLLLPLSYLHGKGRYDEIYTDMDYRLQKVYVFTRYPLLGEPLREDGKHNTGMMVYAWFKWNKNYKGEATIDWLDNNPYILNKGVRK